MKRSTSKLIEAATTANPKRMNTSDNATYPGLFVSALKEIIMELKINLLIFN